jgi:hypothetical protein
MVDPELPRHGPERQPVGCAAGPAKASAVCPDSLEPSADAGLGSAHLGVITA